MALVCFERRPSLPLAAHGDTAWYSVARLLGWRSGEMKYRSVARRARRLGVSIERLLAEIEGHASTILSIRMHSRGDALAEKLGALKALLALLAADRVHLVLDHGLIPCREDEATRLVHAASLRFASSSRTRGIQLADIAAGACMDAGLCTRSEC